MTPPKQEPVIVTGTPAALQPHAFHRLEIVDADDRPVPVTRKGVRVTAGQVIRVKVFVTPADRPPDVQIEPTGRAFKTLLRTTPVADAGGTYYRADFKSQLVSFLPLPQNVAGFAPLPCRGEILVSVNDHGGPPVQITVAAVILPPAKKLLFAAAGLGISVGFLPFFFKKLNETGDVLKAFGNVTREPLLLIQGGAFAVLGAVSLFVVRAGLEWIGTPGD